MSWVFPGRWEVFANPCCLTSILMSEDLPTLERPINAYSGIFANGKAEILVLLQTKTADLMSMV